MFLSSLGNCSVRLPWRPWSARLRLAAPDSSWRAFIDMYLARGRQLRHQFLLGDIRRHNTPLLHPVARM